MAVDGYTSNYNFAKYAIGSNDWGGGMNNNLDLIDTQIKQNADNITSAAGAITGEVKAVAFSTVPSGWLECNGAAVSRTTYSALFSAIGTNFGEGDGSTTFNLPDLRGKFVRGYDNGAGNDPDAASRTAQDTGGNTGDDIGSVQDDAMQGHKHRYNFYDAASPVYMSPTGYYGDRDFNGVGIGSNTKNATNDVIIDIPIEDGTNGTPRTSGETRPVNVSLMYIIKT